MIQKATAMGQLIGSFIVTMSPLMPHVLCRVFGETSNHPGDSAPLQPRFGALQILFQSVLKKPCLFPKLKSPLKGKRFQPVDKTQENTMGQLMVTGRTVWGSKAPKCLYFFIYYMSEYLMDRPHIWKFESGIAIHVFSLPTTLILKTNSSIEMFSNDNNH